MMRRFASGLVRKISGSKRRKGFSKTAKRADEDEQEQGEE